MKTAEEILKSKLDGKITFVNNPDYTFNKVIEAMEEYRLQSHPSPMSAEQRTNAMDVLKKHLKVDWIFSGDSGKAIIDAMEEWKRTPTITDGEQKYIDATKNKLCAICGYFCNNVHHANNWYDITPQSVTAMSAEQVEELGYYYPLFKFFSDEHGLSLLDSQLQDVIHECKKFIEPASPSVKAEGWVSVEDGLPEPLETVWLSNGKGFTSLGCRTELVDVGDDTYNWCWAQSNGIIYEEKGKIVSECEDDDLDVKFWQPLPAPPNVNN